MPVSPQTLRQPHPDPRARIHFTGQTCPTCDQPIPNEKAAQVRARIAAREKELIDSATARFANEKAQLQTAAKAELDALIAQIGTKETAARAEGAKSMAAAMKEKVEAVEKAKVAEAKAALERIAAAEAAKNAAEAQARSIKENHVAELNVRLLEQREALEKAKSTAVLAEQAKFFEERQKLQSAVKDLERKLERERADVLGEGAEVDLYKALKGAFEGDRIRRVPKGTPGADVVHEIVHKGKLCGKLVYDSKNRNDWKSTYASKLCEDKIAEGAQHAILSTLKFPVGVRQLGVKDGVILANPARVVVVAEILRDHIVQTSALRLSNHEREKKKGELYAYILSERFRQHLDTIEGHTGKLLDLDVDEQKAHRNVWERRGRLLKSLEKAQGNMRADVGRIIGTDEKEE